MRLSEVDGRLIRRAVQGADGLLAGVLDKAQFWQRWAGTPMTRGKRWC